MERVKVFLSEKRILGDGYGMRPQLVNPVECKNVLIEDVTLLRSAFWVIHPCSARMSPSRAYTSRTMVLTATAATRNHVRMYLSKVATSTQATTASAIKSGRNRDGREQAIPSENIIVRNCKMKNGHGGIVVGSEISGGFKNLFP